MPIREGINKDCSKCKKPMTPLTGNRFKDFQVTAYRCDGCGHWNDLKRRKPKPQ